MPEMPMCAYAVASDHPNAAFSASRRPLAAPVVQETIWPAGQPKSNGMIVNTSTFVPFAAAWLIRRVPHQVGPVVDVPNVRMVLIPGLFCLTIFNASRILSCTASLSNSSVFSMSTSMNLRLYALITCWYAPASADALEQFGPSLLPLQPPNEISTSPPLARMALMVL